MLKKIILDHKFNFFKNNKIGSINPVSRRCKLNLKYYFLKENSLD